jgi:hypothetical protein
MTTTCLRLMNVIIIIIIIISVATTCESDLQRLLLAKERRFRSPTLRQFAASSTSPVHLASHPAMIPAPTLSPRRRHRRRHQHRHRPTLNPTDMRGPSTPTSALLATIATTIATTTISTSARTTPMPAAAAPCRPHESRFAPASIVPRLSPSSLSVHALAAASHAASKRSGRLWRCRTHSRSSAHHGCHNHCRPFRRHESSRHDSSLS